MAPRPVTSEAWLAIDVLSLANRFARAEFGLTFTYLTAIQSEETRTGPMRTGDRLRDLAERGIGFAGKLKTVLCYDDRMCPPAPFSHKPRSWPDTWTGIRSNAPVRSHFLGQRYESALSSWSVSQ